MAQPEQKKTKTTFVIIISITLLAVLSVIAYAVFLINYTLATEKFTINIAGVFGDSFGVLTSLFSALAFIGVVFTLFYQKQSNETQERELQSQRNELNENRKESIKQGFENSFFQMLKIHNQIVDSITTEEHRLKTSKVRNGREGIKVLQNSLKSSFIRHNICNESNTSDIVNAYDEFYYYQGYQLAHYYRFIYNIFRFLSESNINNKILYIRLARAQISNQELYLIYYNALTKYGSDFKKYIIEFELMDNLPSSELFLDEHKILISDAGFKDWTQ